MSKFAMTAKTATVLAALLVSGEAAAATIYGMIQQGNQPVRNTPVVLNCGGAEAGRTTTDDRGNYRITTPRTGTCSLQVGGASGGVTLYQDPTRYNFDVVGTSLNRR
jgi:hypothetical protein